jgi:uncharacterized membrane protein
LRYLLQKNSIFAWIGLITLTLLLIPFFAMQVSHEVRWTSLDFLVMGGLLMLTGSAFVFLARRLPSVHLALLAVVVFVVFLYLWAELAVGLFFSLGS